MSKEILAPRSIEPTVTPTVALELIEKSETKTVVDHVATGLCVRCARESAGLSAREIARRAGWSWSYQSLLESGARQWTKDKIDRVRKALNG